MIYKGRAIDTVALWQNFIELPADLHEPLPTFLPKVQCPNPAHDTTKRHFQVNTRQPLVHCFAQCGISGSYEHAISVITGCTLREAQRTILKHGRVRLKGAPIVRDMRGVRKVLDGESEVAKDEALLGSGAFQYLPRVARNYLASRGIDAAARGKWEVGYDEDSERITIPAYDAAGTFRFLIRREVLRSSSFKYLYTPGTSKTSILFGQCYLDYEIVRRVGLILVEGPLDVIHMHSVGWTNTVAILGTGISRKQLRLLDRIEAPCIYLLFDRDAAGVYNALQALQGHDGRHRGLRKVPVRVCRWPSGTDDPMDLGGKEVARVVERAITPLKFMQLTRSVRRKVLA